MKKLINWNYDSGYYTEIINANYNKMKFQLEFNQCKRLCYERIKTMTNGNSEIYHNCIMYLFINSHQMFRNINDCIEILWWKWNKCKVNIRGIRRSMKVGFPFKQASEKSYAAENLNHFLQNVPTKHLTTSFSELKKIYRHEEQNETHNACWSMWSDVYVKVPHPGVLCHSNRKYITLSNQAE